jgi:signal transduction histidine kinase
MDERTQAAVDAIREALTNAAKHARVRRVSVFAEVAGDELFALVRDRGRGFDPAAGTPGDRRGIADSIEARMLRHGARRRRGPRWAKAPRWSCTCDARRSRSVKGICRD